MHEPIFIELYALGEKYCVLRKNDILAAFGNNAGAAAENDWQTACEFFSRFTDEGGICTVNLDTILDGNTLDYAKTTAVFLLFATMLKSGVMQKLPPQVAMQAMPYVAARTSAAEIHLAKYKRLDAFVSRTFDALQETEADDRSIDDIFAEITAEMPAVSSFATVRGQMRQNYLEFFGMLYERAQACADPAYAETVSAYMEALS
ncbi:MAG TPA: hypothetical protein DDX71_01575 [Ruminococcus sp.]|nr:hypothetical protein [Ruminococcus sp.]